MDPSFCPLCDARMTHFSWKTGSCWALLCDCLYCRSLEWGGKKRTGRSEANWIKRSFHSVDTGKCVDNVQNCLSGKDCSSLKRREEKQRRASGKMTSFSAVVKTEAGKELAKANTSTEPHWSDGCAEKTFKSEEPIELACLLSLINSLKWFLTRRKMQESLVRDDISRSDSPVTFLINEPPVLIQGQILRVDSRARPLVLSNVIIW